jgi:AbrB family looped-hinge helix DNA binding protein
VDETHPAVIADVCIDQRDFEEDRESKECYPYHMVRNRYSSRVTSKGQVTVPQEIRVRLGLKEGDELEFISEEGRTTIRRARVAPNPFAKYAGVLGTFRQGKSEINAWVNDLRDDESIER